VPEHSYGPAPSGVQGQSTWSGSLGQSPQKLKAFYITFFSDAHTEIKRFDRF